MRASARLLTHRGCQDILKAIVLGCASLVNVSSVAAFDITACGTAVPNQSTGTLQADLTCNAPGVTLGKNAALELNGHTITAQGPCVDAEFRATIRGPGELSGCGTGILSFGRVPLKVSDVVIQGSVGDGLEFQGVGIWAPRAQLTATNVAASNNGNSGMIVHVLKAASVTANGNAHYGITEDRGHGNGITVNGNGSVGFVYGSFGSFENLVAMNNGSPNFASGGLTGNQIILRDSSVTNNQHFDISGFKKPILVNTTCGTSTGGPNSNGSWGVCSND